MTHEANYVKMGAILDEIAREWAEMGRDWA